MPVRMPDRRPFPNHKSDLGDPQPRDRKWEDINEVQRTDRNVHPGHDGGDTGLCAERFHDRRVRRRDRRHRAAPVRTPAGRADRGQRLLVGSARGAADQDAVGPSTHAAERHLHQDKLHRRKLHHPRHRRPVRRHDLRQRDRDPFERRPAVFDPPVRNRILRPRTRRGAARAAGHAVRPQRDLGRGQRDHRQAEARRVPGVGRSRIWQL